MRPSLSAVLFLMLAYGSAYAQRMQNVNPDTIFYNGKIITIDADSHVSESFAIRNGLFLAVGSTNEIMALKGPDTRLVDLNGHAVIPGLIDNHNHQYHTALLSIRGVDMQNISSLSEMFSRIKAAVVSTAPGGPVYTTMEWSAGKLQEKRGPTLAELDDIAPDNPVVVYASRSRLHVNSRALQLLGITDNKPAPFLVSIDRDDSGQPTGLITGEAPSAVMNFAARVVPEPSLDEKKTLITRMQAKQHAMGLTGIRDLQLYPAEMRAYYELWREGKLTMRVSMGLELNAGEEERIDPLLSAWGVGPGFGDEWLRIDGIAEYNPGDQLREPYSNSDDTGTLRLPEQVFIEAIRKINQHGWRPSIHVMGDKTLDLVLAAYTAADKDMSIKDRRWIVEHIPLVHRDQMQKIKDLGVMVSAQFQPVSRAKAMMEEWGQARTVQALPMRDLLDFGIIVSGGSDWPGAPNNPFINIHYYVTRDTSDLGPVGPDQKISRMQAIQVMSLNNAYLTYDEKIKGSIEPGKLADFVILSEDILAVPESRIRNIYPVATYVNGANVYRHPQASFH
jgi:predicted amidohydrolase YtcJ